MKYFAMMNGERKGPFALDQLAEAGVTPSTYVWCKGMKDWEKAEDVADICRYFRQRIAALQHPGVVEMPTSDSDTQNRDQTDQTPDDGLTDEQRKQLEEIPIAFREMVRKSGMIPTGGPHGDTEDYDRQPNTMLVPAIVATLFCCPIVGLVALFYAFRSQTLWSKALKGNDQKVGGKELKMQAHEAARKARMWTGITISAGFMIFGFMIATGRF